MSEQEQEPEPQPEEEEKPEQGEQEIEKNLKAAGVNIEEQKEEQKETKPEVKTTEADERFKKFWAALGEQANVVSQANFEKLIVTNEFQFNGTTYKARLLNYREKHELDTLQEKARTLSEKENWEEWLENQKARACLLIEDMTPERFEKESSYIVTSLISAWGLKPEGFLDLFQSP
jgi:hypothetical protein